MPAKLIDGKALAARVREELRGRVSELVAHGHQPGLAVILVGEDPASQVYVRNKVKACQDVGILSFEYRLASDTSETTLLELIDKLNKDASVDGILVQLPLPQQIHSQQIIQAIVPHKDVDGFHLVNAGQLVAGIGKEPSDRTHPVFVPCTPAGIMRMIDSTGYVLAGKQALVIGRSSIVGKPIALLLLAKDATVTIAHSRTQNLAQLCREADILVAAVGRAKMVGADMVKPGALVIDVGINRGADGKLCGDVDTAAVSNVAGWISPVPGGVGPMTIAMLLENTVLAAEARTKL